MLRSRRYIAALSWLAIVALSIGMFAGAAMRPQSTAPGTIVDSVLGPLVLCHQSADRAAGTGEQPDTLPASRFQHSCPACLTAASLTAPLPAPPSLFLTNLSSIDCATQPPAAVPPVIVIRSSPLGSRAPPKST